MDEPAVPAEDLPATSTTVRDIATTTTTSRPTTSVVEPATTTTSPPISEVNAARLGHSWREGCPVAVSELRLVRVPYVAFDGGERIGEIVAHVDHAGPLLGVFEAIHDAGFPIESVIPIGDLPVDAEDDPRYNNTSAFNCRFVEGTTSWSRHAFGGAIDINPFQNPFVRSDRIWPTGAGEFADRTIDHPAMIRSGDVVVSAFENIGWPWGGNWTNSKDYQHFSSTGT